MIQLIDHILDPNMPRRFQARPASRKSPASPSRKSSFKVLPTPQTTLEGHKLRPSFWPEAQRITHAEPPVRVFERFRPMASLKKFEAAAPKMIGQPSTAKTAALPRLLRTDLSRILTLIFDHSCVFEELSAAAKEALEPVANLRQLADVLCQRHIRPFMDAFEALVHRRIDEVSEFQDDTHGNIERRFKPFSKCMEGYTRIVESIQTQFTNLERIYVQVQDLVKFYCGRVRRGSEVESQYLHDCLMTSWRINSEDIKRVINFLNATFERNPAVRPPQPLEETLLKVTHFMMILDPGSVGQVAESPTPPPDSPVPRSDAVPPMADDHDITAKKKRRPKKKKSDKAKKCEAIAIDLKEFIARDVTVRRHRPIIRFSDQEKSLLAPFMLSE